MQARDHRPIVAIAPVRELAYFDEVTGFAKDIIARVHGNHIEDTVTRIEQLVEPAIAAEHARRSDDAVRRADEAIGRGAATGFEMVAAYARSGRGHELIVENDLQVDGPDTDALDDPVDEVIEAVLEHDGLVTTVPHGALAEHGGIVLILRY